MKTIVVAYDETDPAKRALERAAELASAFGSTVIVTSVSPRLAGSPHGGVGAVDPTDPPEQHDTELQHAQAFLAGKGIQAEIQPAVGDPADAIIEAAETRGADLIVVGSRELGLVQRLLGQSVSQSVAAHAHTDVLIVH
jgi:nucleotide-binding universal stress UspA family protein